MLVSSEKGAGGKVDVPTIAMLITIAMKLGCKDIECLLSSTLPSAVLLHYHS